MMIQMLIEWQNCLKSIFKNIIGRYFMERLILFVNLIKLTHI